MSKMQKTSWSDDQLKQLKDPMNHAIQWDGWGYWWYHFLDGKWELHTIKSFEDYNKPFSWMKYWVTKYGTELNQREEKMLKQLHNTKNTQKRIEIIEHLKPGMSNIMMAAYLKVNEKTIRRNRDVQK